MHVLGSSVLALTLVELLNATFLSRKGTEAWHLAQLSGVLIDVSPFEEPSDVVPVAGRALTCHLYGVKYVCVMRNDGVEGMEQVARNTILRLNPHALVVSAGNQVAYPGREFALDKTMWISLIHIDSLAEVLAEHQRFSGWLTVGPESMVDQQTLMGWNMSKQFVNRRTLRGAMPMVVTDEPEALFVRLKE